MSNGVIRPDEKITQLTGLTRSSRQEAQARNEFPGYITISDRARGVLESDFGLWLEWRSAVTRAKAEGREPPPPPTWTIPPKLKPARDRPLPSQRRGGKSMPRFRGRTDDQRS